LVIEVRITITVVLDMMNRKLDSAKNRHFCICYMFDVFEFETDFAQTLHCIPMQVRLKLDMCSIKLKLEQWNALSDEQKRQLLTLGCNSPEQINYYREFLIDLVRNVTGEKLKDIFIGSNPPWQQIQQLPTEIAKRLEQETIEVTIEQWARLTVLQRFALTKLSQSRNFLPALKEFGLI